MAGQALLCVENQQQIGLGDEVLRDPLEVRKGFDRHHSFNPRGHFTEIVRAMWSSVDTLLGLIRGRNENMGRKCA